ncbi:MAG TPA: nucleotidyltransferase domain-containing protein, partial [Chloroflexota bacterium]|nr:nucleotidyltransferase domain-containing protein [Chloroflexota bacterium]
MSSVTLDLVSDVQQSIAPYLADTTVRVIAAYLFGSASRGEMTPLSDLDIAVYVDEPKRAVRLQTYASLRQGIEQAMSGLGDYQVDLIVLNDAPPMIAGRAIAGKLLYSADEQHRIAYEARVLDEYQDLLPVHERYDRCLHVRILSGLFGTRSRELIDRQVVNDRLAYIQT